MKFKKIYKLIKPNKYVNRLSINYLRIQIRLLLYKFNIFPKYTLIDGVKIPNYKNNIVTFKILSSGSYEKANINILKEHLKPNSFFFDIGTNNGFFSFYFEKRLKNKGKIYAFDSLENLIKLNNEFKKQYNLKINFENIVFSNRSSVENFYYENNNVETIHRWKLNNLKKVENRIFKNKYKKHSHKKIKTIKLNTISFDEYIKKKRIKKVSLLKIDIDGSELKFLQGAIKSIIKFKPHILCELNLKLLSEQEIQNNIKLGKILSKYYKIYKVKKNKLIRINSFSLKLCDGYYFFKKNN